MRETWCKLKMFHSQVCTVRSELLACGVYGGVDFMFACYYKIVSCTGCN